MICYVDPSALVKKYVHELDSGGVISMLDSADEIALSLIAYTEVFSAIYRKKREAQLTLVLTKRLISRFKEDWKGFYKINVSLDVVMLAGELIARHPLRGFDAVHIASALTIKKKLREPIYFLSFDQRQKEAADKENLDIL